MRLLFVNENLGGNATMHRHLRRVLAERTDVDSTVVDVPRRGLARKIASAHLPGLARIDLDFAALRDQLAGSLAARRIIAARAGTFDALHVYTQNAALLSRSKLRSVPSVVSTDATIAQSALLLPYREPRRFTPAAIATAQRLEREVYSSADLVVAQSEWAARSMRSEYSLENDRLRVIPYGIVVADPPVVPELDPPVITFMGRSMDRKGGWDILRVWRRNLRGDCRLRLITPVRVPDEPGVEVVSDLAMGDDVRRNELLAESSLFIFPSVMDTFGYGAIEAMAMGTPVVGYRATAIPETVLDEHTGLLVEPHDDVMLAAAIRRLLGDDDLRRRFGAAARLHVLNRFDAKRTTQAALSALHEAAQRRS